MIVNLIIGQEKEKMKDKTKRPSKRDSKKENKKHPYKKKREDVKAESIRFLGIMTWTLFIVMTFNSNQNSLLISLIQVSLIFLTFLFIYKIPYEIYNKK